MVTLDLLVDELVKLRANERRLNAELNEKNQEIARLRGNL